MPDESTVKDQVREAVDKCLEDLEGLEWDLLPLEDFTPSQGGDTWVVLRMVIRRLRSVEGLVEPARGAQV